MWKYFDVNYGPQGRQAPIKSWSRHRTLGSPPHNLHVERYHRTIKTVLKPNFSIVKFCIGLGKIEDLYDRKSMLVQDGIRSVKASKLQVDFIACHPDSVGDYSIERTDEQILMRRMMPNDEFKTYTLKSNLFHCNRLLCLVHCSKCPPASSCAHEYTCDCKAYAYRNFCKHSHILAMIEHVQEFQSSQEHVVSGDGNDHYESTVNFVPSEDIIDQPVPLETQENGNNSSRRAQIVEELKRKVEEIEKVVNSSTFNDETKDDLINQIQTLPIDLITVPSHPSSFPHLDRKRSHQPQIRSFFPKKKKTKDQQ